MSKNIKLLFSGKDNERLQPVLTALKSRGIRTSAAKETIRKRDFVLAVLSENFLADPALCGILLDLLAAGNENVLPLQMGSCDLPENLKNALYSKNILFSAERDPDLIAERIFAALPQKKNLLPYVLSIAGVILLAIIAVILWRSFNHEEQASEVIPVMDSIYIPENLGLTEEDLAEVRCVVIIGEHFTWYNNENRQRRPENSEWPDMLYQLANASNVSGGSVFDWYWHEDGSKASMTSYDLSFLSYMPKLEELHMAKVRLEEAPDLTALSKLGVVWALDCEMSDIEWLASSNVHKVQIRCDADYSPLSRCENLTCAILDIFHGSQADLSAFSPANLQELDLVCWNRDSADLSGLSSCDYLQKLHLGSVPVRDLSFLNGKKYLSYLSLEYMDKLQDISVLHQLGSLRDLTIHECHSIPDYSPISDCVSLTSIRIYDRSDRLIDTSFLRGHPKLTDIEISIDRMTDLNFLGDIGSRNTGIDFAFAGSAGDYSGLGLVKNYNSLAMEPGEEVLQQLFTYLGEISVTDLRLSRFRSVDLTNMPDVKNSLCLDRCSNKDLSTLPDGLRLNHVELENCSAIRSLEGIQKLQNFGIDGSGSLRVYNCPLLIDWNALSGLDLYSIEITGGFAIPSFDDLNTTKLRLDSVAEISDLSFLRNMNSSRAHTFELVGLEEVKDLSVLNLFHGAYLAVEPQLADQARELVKSGNFEEFRIEYPDGGWQLDLSDLELNSLEELKELPSSMLKRIKSLNIAGDMLFSWEQYEIYEDWSLKNKNGLPLLCLRDRDTGELIKIQQGNISDITIFSELTGLEELNLYYQPIKNMNGIQTFSSLRRFTAAFCPDLTDVSALFTLQDLAYINLSFSPLSSIQGIQNLTQLLELNIINTGVTDFSPLAECDFRAAYEQGGFSIYLNELKLVKDDLDVLGSIKKFNILSFTDQDPAVWMPLLQNSEIHYFDAAGDIRNNTNLATLVEDHPELNSLYIGYCEKITDLTPLLALDDLEQVTVHKDMKKAIKSLEGLDYRFELRIEG